MPEDPNNPARMRWERRQLRKARRGDRRAFAALYEAYAGPLYSRVLYPRLGNAAAAEDALAETFQALLEDLQRFEHRGVSIWFWLARVARNKALDQHRRRQSTGRALASFQELVTPLQDGPENPASTLEQGEEGERMRRLVHETLDRINPRYRQVLELRFLRGEPRAACAAAMEVKLGTLDVLVLRALRAFRKQWSTAIAGDEENTS